MKTKEPQKTEETTVCIKKSQIVITQKSTQGIKQIILNKNLDIIEISNAPTKG